MTAAIQTFQTPLGHVTTWTPPEKLGEAISRSLPHLGPKAREQIEQLLTLEALSLVAAILLAWFGSHAIGLGFFADALLLIAGLVAIGAAIFEGLDHLYQFATKALLAETTSDLDAAAEHFAQAITILGVEAVLAILFRGRPKTYKGERIEGIHHWKRPAGTPPLKGTRDPRYLGKEQGTSPDKLIRLGSTLPNGEIRLYRPPPGRYPKLFIEGHKAARRHAAYHESVHRWFTPRLNMLYSYRIERLQISYLNSSFYRYLEEVFAECIAHYKISGFKAMFRGITFPVREKYFTVLLRRDLPPGREHFKGEPLLYEMSGILAGSFLVHGLHFDVYHSNSPPPSERLIP